MHRNTYALIIALAIIAALVTGVNIGRRTQTATLIPAPSVETTTPTAPPIVENVPEGPATPSSVASASPTVANSAISGYGTYKNTQCGVSLSYDSTLFGFQEISSRSAQLTNKKSPSDMIVLACEKEIPRPALPPEKIQAITIGQAKATLYHTSSAKDGTPVDAVIFTHPTKKMDIMLAGLGTSFQTIFQTLTILP